MGASRLTMGCCSIGKQLDEALSLLSLGPKPLANKEVHINPEVCFIKVI